MNRRFFLVGTLLILLAAGSIFWYTQFNRSENGLETIADIAKAAAKADALQKAELDQSITALQNNDSSRIIWGDRFLRWTVLAYTLWRLDQGDRSIIPKMERLLVLYYERAWYPYVRNRPNMPFPSLISYFHADGTWEDYWNDYKPVYASAFVLEYYLLACYDREWAMQNYPILKNVTDSILQMWLPARHQPTAYVDAFKAGPVEVVEIKNITSSVDSAMVDSSLVAAAQVAKAIGNDEESWRTYESYTNDSLTHFKSEKWDWFPTDVFGSNPSEDYGAALQLGMTMPNIDGDEKIDLYAQRINSTLRLNSNSWLIKWTAQDTDPSSRSVYAAIGLAPKYPEMALRILVSYAHRALQENPWFTSKTDGYEASDPIWVSGKFLEAYTLFKQRTAFGRTVFSLSVLRGNLDFQTTLAPAQLEPYTFNFTFPNLHGGGSGSFQLTAARLSITVTGFAGREINLTFLKKPSDLLISPEEVLVSSHSDAFRQSLTLTLALDGRPVTITTEQKQ